MLPATLDHVLIQAPDLDTAIRQYETFGFTVTPGGRHPRLTHNALVTFADGAYLELIAPFEEPSTDEEAWWYRYGREGGLFGFALGVPSIEQSVAELRERGLAFDGPNPGARSRPDGVEIAWRTAGVEDDQPGALPFLIDDVTPRKLRVPGGSAAHHTNGVTGITALVVAVVDIEAASARYTALLGQEPARDMGASPRFTFQLGGTRLDLVPSTGAAPGGDRVHELILSGTRDQTLDPADAANARLRIVAQAP